MTDNTESLDATKMIDNIAMPDREEAKWEEDLDSLLDELAWDPEDEGDKIKEVHDNIKSAIQPQDSLELYYVLDLIEATYEQYRLRAIKRGLLEVFREQAVKKLLREKHTKERLRRTEGPVDAYVANAMSAWHLDRDAIECRVGKNEIRLEEFSQGRPLIDHVERLLSTAQRKRGTLLREVYGRREFVQRAREVTDRFIEHGPKSLVQH